MKYVSWLDNHGKVRVHLLDLDASEGTAKDCAKAISKSLKKLCVNKKKIVFKGQSTDSGGGGVLDNLARELRLLGLCAQEDEYLIAACFIHCLQLQLSKPTKDLIGEGAPNARNAMQALHTIYDLQGYMEWRQVVAMMDHSQQWVDSHLDGYFPEDPSNSGDADFANKHNKVLAFRQFTKLDKQNWRACPACVLTRWQYVGGAASYGFEYYLVLLKFTQLCINRHGSNNKINKAASNLQSLLVEPSIYSNVCLLNCFHEGYFKDHMDWMMQGDDLTNVAGFQVHQMFIRFYLMERDLCSLKEDVNDYNGFFHHFVRSLNLVDSCGPLHNDAAQRVRAQKFVDTAIKSNEKHFRRWCSLKMIPAALLAEKPLAMIIARTITGTASSFTPEPIEADFPTRQEYYDAVTDWDTAMTHRSKAHSTKKDKRLFSLRHFETWCKNVLQDLIGNDAFSDELKQTCHLMLSGVDFHKYNSHPLVHKLWSTYLPLASQTQFVERGVKEAKVVAATGRLEEQRSAHAIVRSFTLLSSGIERQSPAPDRIKLLLNSVDCYLKTKASIILRLGSEWYEDASKEARKHLHGEHFKHQRVDDLIEDVIVVAERNKADNVRQKTTGVPLTMAQLNLIPYSKVLKALHTNDLITELQFRGFVSWKHPSNHDKKADKRLDLHGTEE